MVALISFGTACTRSEPSSPKLDETLVTQRPAVNEKIKTEKEKSLFSKELKESLHFAASLERESLRLISRNNSLEATSLFSVLSYAFEVASGTKKNPPRNMDCGRFQIEKGDLDQLKILKVCEKPYAVVALVQSRMQDAEIEVTFKIKEWASVVGLSVTLTNPDIVCQLRMKEKKLSSMVCEHWAYFLSSSDASATEVHLKTFSFYRDQALQLKLSGGFFHDLIERKKIDITVPLEGKIKLIEKEIEVKDDFADKIKTSEEIRNEKEKEYQEHIKAQGQTENQSQGQSASQDQTPGENQSQVEGQNPSEENHPAPPSEISEGENSGGVPQQPPKNRGR